MAAKPLISGLVVAGVLLGTAFALKQAQHAGLINADTTARAFQALMGLIVAYYGNLIPKNLGRLRSIEHERRVQRVLRLSGWAFTIAGLAYAALSFLKPVEFANTAAMFVMAGAVAVTLISVFACRAGMKRVE